MLPLVCFPAAFVAEYALYGGCHVFAHGFICTLTTILFCHIDFVCTWHARLLFWDWFELSELSILAASTLGSLCFYILFLDLHLTTHHSNIAIQSNWVTMKGMDNISSRCQPRSLDYFKISMQQKEGNLKFEKSMCNILCWTMSILECHQWQITGLTLSSVDDIRVNPSV